MQEYDIDIMKKNISTLMDKHNVSQTTLALEIGVPQPRISRILNGKDSFTIPQLVKIAKRFHVSVDDLLGLEPEEVEHEATLTDVYNALFDLNKIINLDIVNTPIYESDGMPSLQPEYIPTIHLENKHIEKVLYQWKSLVETELNEELKKKVLDLWENEIICSQEYRPLKWGFRTEEEYACYLATQILEKMGAALINNETVELIKKHYFYIIRKIGESNYNNVLSTIDILTKEIPFDIDEELPFN